MATAAKFSGAEREKLFAQLEVPFDSAQIKWRVMRTSDDRRSGALLPFADPREIRLILRAADKHQRGDQRQQVTHPPIPDVANTVKFILMRRLPPQALRAGGGRREHVFCQAAPLRVWLERSSDGLVLG